MQEFKVNQNGDWDLGVVITGKDAVIQAIKQRLKFLKGEAFWAETEGMIYFDVIGNSEISEAERIIIQSKIEAEISLFKEVKQIEGINISIKNKQISYDFSVMIDDNLIQINNSTEI